MNYKLMSNLIEQLLKIFKWPMSLMASYSIRILKKLNFSQIVSFYNYNNSSSTTRIERRHRRHDRPPNLNAFFILILVFYLINNSVSTKLQSSSYRLVGSSSSYAQYTPWYPCQKGSLIFEFKTHEPNGLLVYAQSLPYKYVQLSLTDGNLRMRMRIGEKDNPRGVFLVYQSKKLNDEKWHEIKITRMNERTILSVDNDENLFHVHKDANLEGNDLDFGDFMNSNENGYSQNSNLLVIGGLPNEIQTYDLSLGTALFEHRFNGFIRNVRVSNCTSELVKLNVISSNSLRFITETDSCASNPCLNRGVCLIVSDSLDNYKCDCSFTNYEGRNCDKCINFYDFSKKIFIQY